MGGEEFPNSLGLIGIPSTQGSSLFLNCLVAHEMGEYVFAEKSLRNRLQPEVETALHVVCGSAYQAREKTEKSFFIDTILKWSKELFCDFFAVHLIGLSYTLAYIELFDLVNLLDRDGAIKSSSPQPPIHFYSAHPSHPFRVKHQTDLLKRLDWWPYVSGIDSRYVRVMEALGGLDDASFIDANDTANKALVESFLKVLPEVAAELGKIVGSLDTGVHEFSELRKDILSYLQEGIVPSTLMIENPGGAVVKARPSGMALLNSFSCFYLENVEPLMARAGQESGPAERRVYWIRKLESWISKALEDSNLLGES